MKKVLIVVIIIIIGYAYFHNRYNTSTNSEQVSVSEQDTGNSDDIIASAYSNRESDVQVSGQGRVIRLLSDDNDGSRHQRFILQLDSGQTLLVVHNIDIASRVASIGKGDLIQFNGEYEWNDEGGVIHWTHNDPDGLHTAGWLKHQGQIYQ
jgi:Protein of unknown function (DUF3465)